MCISERVTLLIVEQRAADIFWRREKSGNGTSFGCGARLFLFGSTLMEVMGEREGLRSGTAKFCAVMQIYEAVANVMTIRVVKEYLYSFILVWDVQ